jgi:hypothetical protein
MGFFVAVMPARGGTKISKSSCPYLGAVVSTTHLRMKDYLRALTAPGMTPAGLLVVAEDIAATAREAEACEEERREVGRGSKYVLGPICLAKDYWNQRWAFYCVFDKLWILCDCWMGDVSIYAVRLIRGPGRSWS